MIAWSPTCSQQCISQSFISAQDRDEALAEKRLAESELLDAKDDRGLAEIERRKAAKPGA